ncbi:hypothetical protein CUMW_227780 [Citrus unshiu]|nr:hypothetical protein CUMW_227780 [Citrus unshiu]
MRRNKKEEEQVKETSFTNLYENSLFEVLKHADTRTSLQAALRQQAMAQDTQNEHLWKLICTHHFANVGCATQQLRSVVLALGGSRRLHSLYLGGSRRFLSLPFFLSQSKPKLKSLTPQPQNLSFASTKQNQSRLRPVVSTLRNYSSATKQENSKGFDRGITIWCRIIHNSSPFYVVFIWNGPDLRPTGSEFHSMLVIHSLKHGEEADDDSVEGSHTLTANNFDSYSHEYPILAVNFYDPWCYWSKCLDDLQ